MAENEGAESRRIQKMTQECTCWSYAYHWLLLALLDVSYSGALQISRWLMYGWINWLIRTMVTAWRIGGRFELFCTVLCTSVVPVSCIIMSSSYKLLGLGFVCVVFFKTRINLLALVLLWKAMHIHGRALYFAQVLFRTLSTKVTAPNSTVRCHMFRSYPDLIINIQNMGRKNCLYTGVFTTTSRLAWISSQRIEMLINRQNLFKLQSIPIMFPKLGELWLTNG